MDPHSDADPYLLGPAEDTTVAILNILPNGTFLAYY